MNNHKIDFIICTNDNKHFSEASLYIENLDIPCGYEVNILEIRDAVNIFAGYNEGMKVSDAKYKVYMHQDVRIIDNTFLDMMLSKFQDSQVGMLGVVGSTRLEVQPWQWNAGAVVETRVNKTFSQFFSQHETDVYVKQIDGILMATQYDLPWREDIFTGWDIYDCSQCCEFMKAGYKIIVPAQKKPICLHDCGIVDMSGYYSARNKFIANYCELFDEEK